MEKNVETEIKLLIGKKDMKTLLASPLVAKKTKKKKKPGGSPPGRNIM